MMPADRDDTVRESERQERGRLVTPGEQLGSAVAATRRDRRLKAEVRVHRDSQLFLHQGRAANFDAVVNRTEHVIQALYRKGLATAPMEQ